MLFGVQPGWTCTPFLFSPSRAVPLERASSRRLAPQLRAARALPRRAWAWLVLAVRVGCALLSERRPSGCGASEPGRTRVGRARGCRARGGPSGCDGPSARLPSAQRTLKSITPIEDVRRGDWRAAAAVATAARRPASQVSRVWSADHGRGVSHVSRGARAGSSESVPASDQIWFLASLHVVCGMSPISDIHIYIPVHFVCATAAVYTQPAATHTRMLCWLLP